MPGGTSARSEVNVGRSDAIRLGWFGNRVDVYVSGEPISWPPARRSAVASDLHGNLASLASCLQSWRAGRFRFRNATWRVRWRAHSCSPLVKTQTRSKNGRGGRSSHQYGARRCQRPRHGVALAGTGRGQIGGGERAAPKTLPHEPEHAIQAGPVAPLHAESRPTRTVAQRARRDA
jgi:hypothetical protein